MRNDSSWRFTFFIFGRKLQIIHDSNFKGSSLLSFRQPNGLPDVSTKLILNIWFFWNLGNMSNNYQPSISHSGILWCWWPMSVPQPSFIDSKKYFLNFALGWIPFLLHNISFIHITFWHSMMWWPIWMSWRPFVTNMQNNFTNILWMIFQKIQEIRNVRYTLTIFYLQSRL